MSSGVPDLTVIVPVYNEEKAVGSCFTELMAVLARCAFSAALLFVNDASIDSTEAELNRRRIPHVSHAVNAGYGAAIKTGARQTASPWIGIIDCDLTYPAAEIPRLMEYAKHYDMVVGARDVRINPWVNKQCKRAVSALFTRRFGQAVADINSGLRIFRRDVFLHYAPAICDRFSLTSSITLGFLLDRRPIKYVPIEYRGRVGHTKVRPFSYTRDFLTANMAMYRFCRDTKAAKSTSA